MSQIQFRRATRRQAKLRLGICGPAGAGKTYSALEVAFGIGGRVVLIDTESGSGELYAHLGEYDVCTLSPPFRVQDYIDAIKAAESAGYDVIILDSITHAWAGEGGLLEEHDNVTRRTGNSYTAWSEITPLHRQFVEAMLQCKSHLIATMRSKTEYVLSQNDKGKMAPQKVGMAPIQRDGMDYEFTVVFDMDAAHTAAATKDRTSLFTGRIFTPGRETGKALKEWLELGAAPVATPPRSDPTSRTPPVPSKGPACEVCGGGLDLEYLDTIKAETGGRSMCKACFTQWWNAKQKGVRP